MVCLCCTHNLVLARLQFSFWILHCTIHYTYVIRSRETGSCTIQLRICIFLKLIHFMLQKAFIKTPGSCGVALRWTHTFSETETGTPFTAIIQIGTDRTMWNIKSEKKRQRRQSPNKRVPAETSKEKRQQRERERATAAIFFYPFLDHVTKKLFKRTNQ